MHRLRGSEYSVISLSNDNLEVSFKSSYDPSVSGTRLPLTIDQRWIHYSHKQLTFMKQVFIILLLSCRYIVRSGVSGFYCYAIYERPQGCPPFDLAQTRMVFKLQRDR